MHQKAVVLIFKCLVTTALLANQPVMAQTDTVKSATLPDADNFLTEFETYQADHQISGLIAVADRHQYPFPQKVLQLQKQLALNPRQVIVLTSIDKDLKRKVKEMNGFLITNEDTMDSLFRNHHLNNGRLIFYTNRYGLYQGELRNALLQACLKAEAILTNQQIKKYNQLQGF